MHTYIYTYIYTYINAYIYTYIGDLCHKDADKSCYRCARYSADNIKCEQ